MVKKASKKDPVTLESIEDDLRDLVNWISIKSTEEEIGESAAKDLVKKVKAIALKLGVASL